MCENANFAGWSRRVLPRYAGGSVLATRDYSTATTGAAPSDRRGAHSQAGRGARDRRGGSVDDLWYD
jgi:hypothetical protein